MKNMGSYILDRNKCLVSFRVYAANRRRVKLQLKRKSEILELNMQQEEPGFFCALVEGMGPELLYKYKLDNKDSFPDPYSEFLPEGMHGFSQVVDHQSYNWNDQGWTGIEWEKAVIYEMHIGTFTPEGTFNAAAKQLDYLCELGINTVEILPVTQTPGRWNWGYDGVNLFSVNHNYGTPAEFKAFVDRCHTKGLAVLLDVVYNHFGPEGNYLSHFGPYFTEKYKTPWGAAVNYDDRGSEIMRRMVLDSVRYWLEYYHLDGLRLDAVHAIKDGSPAHILQDIAATARQLSKKLNRRVVIVAETDENNVQLINPPEKGGFGIDAQWMDDFHHTIHAILTGENKGYYVDYGKFHYLEKVYKNYLYTGEYSRFWKKRRGTDGAANPGRQFVVAIQTHDQVGNRAKGERLSQLVEFPYLKAAAGLLFFSPYIPMLFMGEEYAENNPFLFFTDYGDPKLKAAVYQGRKKEFASFGWQDVPDPEDERTFYASRLTPQEKWQPAQRALFRYYRHLIGLRKNHPVLQKPDKQNLSIKTDPIKKLVQIKRWRNSTTLTALCNLGTSTVRIDPPPGLVLVDSEKPEFGGSAGESINTLTPGRFIIIEQPP